MEYILDKNNFQKFQGETVYALVDENGKVAGYASEDVKIFGKDVEIKNSSILCGSVIIGDYTYLSSATLYADKDSTIDITDVSINKGSAIFATEKSTIVIEKSYISDSAIHVSYRGSMLMKDVELNKVAYQDDDRYKKTKSYLVSCTLDNMIIGGNINIDGSKRRVSIINYGNKPDLLIIKGNNINISDNADIVTYKMSYITGNVSISDTNINGGCLTIDGDTKMKGSTILFSKTDKVEIYGKVKINNSVVEKKHVIGNVSMDWCHTVNTKMEFDDVMLFRKVNATNKQFYTDPDNPNKIVTLDWK